MKRAALPLATLALPVLLAACAPATQPAAQPVYSYAGEARFLLTPQKIRVTYTVDPVTHEARGEYRNLTSGGTFILRGTQLPRPGGATLTATIDPGDTPRLNASLLGFGVSNVPLRASGLLGATVTSTILSGTLTVGGVKHNVTLRAER
ncbi:hypothetical protein [Deinococcus aquaticus]|uniref:Lipoprotein n=1 Tax=Deinococcus aquaticus TaxID=328692 RepID=A0ABY7UYF1_9DEIO|nr:hypothetical protein [Deinococcus aquaticus]WDA57946.1 hypothetical protein M8445_11360 [Deinococcus aquaticus]